MITRILLAAVLGLFLTTSISIAQTPKYIGAAKCKPCHNSPAKGEQYNQWASTTHATAFETLKNEKSMEYAKANGIADPTKEASCLKCHSTAAAVDPGLNISMKIEEGVTCESCHGPGSLYKAPTIMKSREASIQNGLILPTQELCITCHNPENPFHKEFNFDEYYAKISHKAPQK